MTELDDFNERLEELLADFDYKLVKIDESIDQDVVPQYILGRINPVLISGQRTIRLNISAIRIKP